MLDLVLFHIISCAVSNHIFCRREMHSTEVIKTLFVHKEHYTNSELIFWQKGALLCQIYALDMVYLNKAE